MNKIFHASRRQSGFTLIELLVVIAIIAILMATLLPSLSKARLNAQRVAGLSVMRGLMAMVLTYTHENDQYLPGPLYNAQYCVYLKDPARVCYPLRDYFHLSDTSKQNQLIKQMAPPRFVNQYDYTYSATAGYACYFFVNNIYPDQNGSTMLKPWGGVGYTGADALPKKYYSIPSPYRYVAIIDHDAQLRSNTGGFVGTSFLIPEPLYIDRRNAAYYDGHGESLPLNADIWYSSK